MPSWLNTSGAKSAAPVHPTHDPCRSCRIGTRALTRPPGLVCHSSSTQATGSRLAAMTIRLARILPSCGRHDTRADRDRASRKALPETSPVEQGAHPCCHRVFGSTEDVPNPRISVAGNRSAFEPVNARPRHLQTACSEVIAYHPPRQRGDQYGQLMRSGPRPRYVVMNSSISGSTDS